MRLLPSTGSGPHANWKSPSSLRANSGLGRCSASSICVASKADSLKEAREVSYAAYEYSFPVTPRASPSGDMFGGTFAETNPGGRNVDTAEWKVKILESAAPGEPSKKGSN